MKLFFEKKKKKKNNKRLRPPARCASFKVSLAPKMIVTIVIYFVNINLSE